MAVAGGLLVSFIFVNVYASAAVGKHLSHQLHLFIISLQAIILLYFIIEDHDTLFVMAEAVHLAGIGILAYKLLRKKNCGGELSVREKTNILIICA